MSVTITIKQVPEWLANGLRQRAAANHRSQQQELLLMLEQAIGATASGVHIGERPHAVYHTGTTGAGTTPPASGPQKTVAHRPDTDKLSLDALWRRARQLGASMPSESSTLVRVDRDAIRG